MKILNKSWLLLMGSWALLGFPTFAAEALLEDLDLAYARQPEAGLIVGGQPSKKDLQWLANRGVRIIVNLRAPGEFNEFNEAKVAEGLGMTYVNIPVFGMKDLTPENAKLLHDALEGSEGPALVHCTIGMRAGGLMAVEKYLFHGIDEQAAGDYAAKAHLGHLRGEIEDALERFKKND